MDGSSSSSPSPVSFSSPRTIQYTNISFLALLTLLVGYSFRDSVELRGEVQSLVERGEEVASTNSSSNTPTTTCDGFFTVLANVWADSEKNCTTLYNTYLPSLLDQDEWMFKTGSRFTVFTTWSSEELQEDECANYAKNVGLNATTFRNFDPEALLSKHGFTGTQIHWMKHWQDTVPKLHHALTRLSDVFRIVLQKEYHMAYADLDVAYLMDDPPVYLQDPNVAVPVWSEEMGAMEIQNSAFCFSNPQLDVLLDNIKAIMNDRGDSQLTENRYIYTGLGPNLFQHSLQQLTLAGPTLRMYVTHSNDYWKLEDVAKLHQQYGGFAWLHLDGSKRRHNFAALSSGDQGSEKGDEPIFAASLNLVTSTNSSSNAPTCDGFFTVLANVWAASEKNCTTLYDSYLPLLLEHDEWMFKTGSRFTVFTTWSSEELQHDECANYAKYAGLNSTTFRNFDPEALLLKHGFTETQINWMKHWQDTVPRLRHALTRLSDVFRIVLQKEYHMAYADLDVVYLMDDPRVYLQVPNVAVPVWSEEKGAMEIQNSAFCFSNPQLDVLLDNTRAIMNNRGDSQLKQNKYIYTGLGPNLLQHSLQQLTLAGPELRMYVTHSDDHWKLEDVSKLHQQYGGFVWLHLDGSNRRRNWYRNRGQTYRQLVQQLKAACPPPNITSIPPYFE